MLIHLPALLGCRFLLAATLALVLWLTAIPQLLAQKPLAIAPRSTNQNQVELRWPSQVGERFALWSSTNPASGFVLLSTGLLATPPTNIWWADRHAANNRFFRQSTDSVGPQPPNIVTNGNFSNGLAKWTAAINSSVDANIAVVNGESVISIGTNAGTAAQLQLIQTGIPLTNGRTYTLKFDARSLPLGRQIDARLTSVATPRTNYLQQDALVITPSMTTHTVVFVMTNATDPAARILFNFGGDTNDVVLDNVVLCEGEWFQTRAESHELVRRMGTGNNFMASWATQGHAAPKDAALLNQSHFNHCRIGYKMDELCGAGPSYTIPTNEMQQLQDLVDYCLAEGLVAIVDPVHNWANGPGYTNADLPKLHKIWQQVATNFASYPVDMVAFEILNEPHTGANVSNINSSVVSIIRTLPGNQKRQVIVSGEGFSTRNALISAFDNDWIPANDPYLIGTFHYYDPNGFTKQGDPVFNPAQTNTFWGTTNELAQIDLDFEAVKAANNAWALRHGTEPLPVYLGEFGVDNFAPVADRKRWLARIRMAALKQGFTCAHWAMYNNDPSAKGMGPWTTAEVNNPALRTFDAAPLEAMTTYYEAENQTFSGGVTNNATDPGYMGTGYAKFPAATGTNVYCQINGYIPTTDTYIAEIRYSSTNTATLSLKSLNDSGNTVQTQNLAFPSTGSQNNWAVLKATVNLQAGENARLQIIAATNAGPNLDYVRYTR